MNHRLSKRTIRRFGAFEADLEVRELRRDGALVKLQDQPFEMLSALLERPGEVVSREELTARLWKDGTFVDFEAGLNTAVKRLRDALGDSADNPRFVQTLARRGYRFIAPLDVSQGNARSRKQWPVWVGAGAAAAALLVWIVLPVTAPAKITSLAVLPMANLSRDAGEEYLAEGMTEAVIASLAQVKSLEKVVSRTSVLQFKGTKTPAPEIAKKLGVTGIVEGAVQRYENRVRVTVQLIDARRDRQVWSRRYDRDLRDILMLQNEIARAIAEEVQAALAPEEQRRLAANRKVDPRAYLAYARGRRLCDLWTSDGIQKSIRLFDEAVETDPQFAEAYVANAECLMCLTTWGMERPEVAWPMVRRNVQKAVDLGAAGPSTHAILGHVALQADWNWPAADRETRRAVEVGPSSARARTARSVYLTAMGRMDEALQEAKRAERLSPGSSIEASYVPWINVKQRRYEDSVQAWRRILEVDPHAFYATMQLVFALTRLGRAPEAAETYRELRKAMNAGKEQLADGWVMEYEVATGRRTEALKTTEGWVAKRAEKYVDAFHIAWMYSVLGRKDDAMRWLETAYEERSAGIYVLKVDPTMDGLRGDPRFEVLLKRLKFPE